MSSELLVVKVKNSMFKTMYIRIFLRIFSLSASC